MNWTELAPWVVALVATLGFILNTITNIRNGAWNTAERERALTDKFTQAVNDLKGEQTAAIHGLQKDMNEGFNTFTVRFSDSLAALREHTHKIENNTEKEFLRKVDANRDQDVLITMIKAMDEKIQAQVRVVEEQVKHVRSAAGR